MFDLYFDLPSWLRTTFALVLLSIGGAMTYYGHEGRPKVTQDSWGHTVPVNTKTSDEGSQEMFKIGLLITGMGAALLLVCGKDRAEKSGYHF